MVFRIRDAWRPTGTVNRVPYALMGFVGVVLKYNLDRFTSLVLFDRTWTLTSPWAPLSEPLEAVRSLRDLPSADSRFLLGMLATALPFIWIGVAMTVKRLRSIGLPLWLVILFFVPFVNLLFFLVLGIVPSRERMRESADLPGGVLARSLDLFVARSEGGAILQSILLCGGIGAALAFLGASFMETYGLGLFVALPFCLGLVSVLLAGTHVRRSFKDCLFVSTATTASAGTAVIAIAVEGLICVLMALPIALALSTLGGWVGYEIQKAGWNRASRSMTMTSLVLIVPVLMQVEAMNPHAPPLYEVTTSITIEAPPEAVWRNVVSFSEIEEPPAGILRWGIAYPLSARIDGAGPGAVRHCVFTTGEFVEPIEIWDEPRLLEFAVTEVPPPMTELSPWGRIDAPHLHGFLVSKRGRFRLTALPDGATRLEGTTWYRHGLWPATYWRLWSDPLIHRIHERVLQHIKMLSES